MTPFWAENTETGESFNESDHARTPLQCTTERIVEVVTSRSEGST